jgi:hypothetical protein
MSCGPLWTDGRRGTLLRRTLIAGLAGAVTGLSGCAIVPPGGVTSASPSPTVSATTAVPSSPGTSAPATSPPPQSATAVPTATPDAPTASPTAAPSAVKATGTLLTYSNMVSDQLTGTCQTTKDAPGFMLSDAQNDFYGTVDLAVVLKAGREAVTSVRADFGEDFEGTTRKLAHPETGTSATVSAKGSTYTVKGKVRMYEGSSKKGTLVPFTLTVTCAGDTW